MWLRGLFNWARKEQLHGRNPQYAQWYILDNLIWKEIARVWLSNLKFGFSAKATKFEKVFVVLLTRASCSVRAAAYLSKSRQRFFKTNVVNSMTTLLTHTVAHSTKPSFRSKTNNQPLKKFLSLALSWTKVVKNWTSF